MAKVYVVLWSEACIGDKLIAVFKTQMAARAFADQEDRKMQMERFANLAVDSHIVVEEELRDG